MILVSQKSTTQDVQWCNMPGRHRFSVNVDFDYRLPPATISVTDVGSASLSVRIYASYLLRTLEDG